MNGLAAAFGAVFRAGRRKGDKPLDRHSGIPHVVSHKVGVRFTVNYAHLPHHRFCAAHIMKIGFSTDSCNSVAAVKARLDLFRSLACSAVEISLPNVAVISQVYEQRQKLAALVCEGMYISIHAPRLSYDDSPQIKEVLNKLAGIATVLNAKTIVVHPHEISSFTHLKALGSLIALENMDWKTPDARFPDELERYLGELPQAGVVLDLNHVYTHDKTMLMASEFWKRFSTRVRYFHMSGFIDEVRNHVPFSASQCDSIISALPTLQLPIILEIGASRLPVEQVHSEFEYVMEHIAQRR